MVEYTLRLDSIFGALSDPTRRDILDRVMGGQLTVSEIALPYKLSLAAISKHLSVLERARLIRKKKVGRHQFITLSPPAIKEASKALEHYRELWEGRLNRLDNYLLKQP